jgi:uncharacterized membrane protein
MDFVCELFGSGMLWWLAMSLSITALLFWPASKEKGESVWDILNRKFAEGALSVEEYQQRRLILEQHKVKK